MINFNEELNYINKQLKKINISIERAMVKPNVAQTELESLNKTLNILNNIKQLILKNNINDEPIEEKEGKSYCVVNTANTDEILYLFNIQSIFQNVNLNDCNEVIWTRDKEKAKLMSYDEALQTIQLLYKNDNFKYKLVAKEINNI